MKLFYFTSIDLVRATGGCRNHVEGIVRGFHEHGWEVTLFSADTGRGDAQPAFPFPHVKVLKRKPSLAHQILEQLRLFKMLFLKKREKPDAIYMRAGRSFFIPACYAVWKKVPFFMEFNALIEMEASHRLLVPIAVKLENWMLRRCAGAFPVTIELKNYLSQRASTDPDKFQVIPNGCEKSLCEESLELAKAVPEPEAPVIGFLGSFEPWQGVETVLRAMPILRERVPGVKFLIAGKGKLEGAYRNLMAELGIEDCVTFVGFMGKPEILPFLHRCGVVVAPRIGAFREDAIERFVGTSPIKMFSYLGAGRLVVTSNLKAMDLFREFPAVFWAEPDDPADYARVLEQVLRLPMEKRIELGRAGRQRILDRYTWGALADQAGAAITALLEQNKPMGK